MATRDSSEPLARLRWVQEQRFELVRGPDEASGSTWAFIQLLESEAEETTQLAQSPRGSQHPVRAATKPPDQEN